MKSKIGYLIPVFPGQTHIFFWREKTAIENRGIQVDVVSTRRPPKQIISHAWTEEAMRDTTYLFSPLQYLSGTVLELLRCGPRALLRCGQAAWGAKGSLLVRRLRRIALIIAGAKLAHIARTRGWRHLHVHSCADSANIALFASLLSGLPYSITLHGPLSDYGDNQEQKWSHARFAVVITQSLLAEVRAALGGFLPPRVEVAPMGVDISVFSRSHRYRPWDRSGCCQIFSCGRLNPVKGHADLIKAVALLRKQGIDAKLTIAGEDEQGGSGYRVSLTTLIKQLELDDSVRLLGAVSEAVVRSLLEEAHVFVLASLHEPLGVAIMEAMAAEVPVVVGDSPGVRELVDDGISGILVQPEAPAQLSDAIKSVLDDPDLAIRLGSAGREKIAAQFQSTRSAAVLYDAIFLSEAPDGS